MLALDALESLELIGSGQWGLVTTGQAAEAGVSKMQLSRLAERGTLQRVRHGVYALPSADAGPLQGLRAAWLATGSGPVGSQPLVVVSGESAAAVHGLGDLLPSKYEFSSAVRRQTSQPDTRYRKRDLADEDVTWVNGLPVTSVARTLKDLAAGGTDADHLAGVVQDVVNMSDAVSVELTRALTPESRLPALVDTNALLDSALRAAPRAPAELVELLVPEFRERLVEQLVPQLRNVLTHAFAEQLRQLAPASDGTQLAQQLLRSALPDTKALVRTLTQQPRSQMPSADAASHRDGEALVAGGRQNRDVVDGGPDDPAGGELAQGVSEREAGEGGPRSGGHRGAGS